MPQRSGLALAVLALLVEAPMHPYRIQQLIRERGKADVINVGQRSQLYKTIDRLLQDGLIEVHTTERDPARPERTVYAATDAGTRTATEWTIGMLTAPRPNFPEFTAALAYLPLITPQVTVDALQARLSDLRARLATLHAQNLQTATFLPRIVYVETEYMIAHLETDIAWIDALVDDLRTGRLSWSVEELRRLAEQFEGPSSDHH